MDEPPVMTPLPCLPLQGPVRIGPWSITTVNRFDGTWATGELDVELHEGVEPDARRPLADSRDWATVMDTLNDLTKRLGAEGHTRVLVRGSMQLSMWFGVGAALGMAPGFEVGCDCGGDLWSSEQVGDQSTADITLRSTGDGRDLAVVVTVAPSAPAAVQRFLADAQLPAGSMLSVAPSAADPWSPKNGAEAAALARAIRDAVGASVEATAARRIHLFLAVPAGLALLVGHAWSAGVPTVVYEHTGARGYQRTVSLPGNG